MLPMKPTEYLEAIQARMARVSIVQLSRASGVSRRQLLRIITGEQSPSISTLQQITDGLRLVKPAKKPTAKRPAAPSAASATTRRPARSAATSASGDAGSAGLGE